MTRVKRQYLEWSIQTGVSRLEYLDWSIQTGIPRLEFTDRLEY